MQQEQPDTPIQEEIDRAVIEALKVFARRGRFLREQRECAAQSQTQSPLPNETGAEATSNRVSEPPSS